MDTATPPFRGFRTPAYTQVPDELFDELLATLSGAELKVLLYVVRRTFGFKKASDRISLNQICGGITTKDGRVLDRGTGLSQSTVQIALKSLIEQNVIVATKHVTRERGNEATTYTLNVAGGFTENRRRGSPETGEGLHRKSAAQETEQQQTGLQPSNTRSAHAGRKEERKPIPAEPLPRSHPSGFQPLATLLERRRPAALPEGVDQVLRPYIAEVGRAFGDRAPLQSSTVRAVNLLKRAGVPIEVFIARLYEARSLTRERTQTRRRRSPATAGAGRLVTQQMAYFFTVLEDLLGQRQRPPPAGAA